EIAAASSRREHPRHGSLRPGRRLRRRTGDLPELAADHPYRLRGGPVLPRHVDGPGPHPLYAVREDLRAGGSAVLEGPGPADRQAGDEHDADRPYDPRHLLIR